MNKSYHETKRFKKRPEFFIFQIVHLFQEVELIIHLQLKKSIINSKKVHMVVVQNID